MKTRSFGQKIIDVIRWKKIPKEIPFVQTYFRKSYSQDGEDIVLASFYEAKPEYIGYYVDIGAHHPLRFSNTQLFYEKGWRGINIDATPNSMLEFNKLRNDDINLELAISNKEENITYYCFEEPALNCLDKAMAEVRISEGWKLKEEISVQTKTINQILEQNLPQNQKIDFINIDIEGVDYEVLKSLDFDKYAPNYFLIEELDFVDKDIANCKNSKIYQYLKSKDYIILGKTRRTCLYAKNI